MSLLGVGLAIFGLILFLGGLGYHLPEVEAKETALIRAVQAHTRGIAIGAFFRTAWILGTTPFVILALASLFFHNSLTALLASAIYLCAALAERMIKVAMKRPRPFEAHPEIVMRQPHPPRDPSFPSGDCLRAWYLAVIIPFLLQLPWPFVALGIFLAGLVAAGRIVMGVHYPSDAIAGTGLALLSAGFLILISVLI